MPLAEAFEGRVPKSAAKLSTAALLSSGSSGAPRPPPKSKAHRAHADGALPAGPGGREPSQGERGGARVGNCC
eukprot:15470679-Alexandrium_andersonii.AAC.1